MAAPESRRGEMLKTAKQMRHTGGSYEIARPLLEEIFGGWLAMAVREIPQAEKDAIIASVTADRGKFEKKIATRLDAYGKTNRKEYNRRFPEGKPLLDEITGMADTALISEAERRIKKRAFIAVDFWHKDGSLAMADPEADEAWDIYEEMWISPW